MVKGERGITFVNQSVADRYKAGGAEELAPKVYGLYTVRQYRQVLDDLSRKPGQPEMIVHAQTNGFSEDLDRAKARFSDAEEVLIPSLSTLDGSYELRSQIERR